MLKKTFSECTKWGRLRESAGNYPNKCDIKNLTIEVKVAIYLKSKYFREKMHVVWRLFMFKYMKISAALVAGILTFTSSDSVASNPEFAKLEERFSNGSTYFGGFKNTDFDFAEQYRSAEPVGLLFKDDALLPEFKKFEELVNALAATQDLPKLQFVQKALAKVLENPEQQSLLNYVSLLMFATFAISEYSEDEKGFFKTAGFSKPYNFLTEGLTEVILDTTLENLRRQYNILENMDHRGDFHHPYTRLSFNDRSNVLSKEIKKSQFYSTTYLMVCAPGEDVFGFFYLAYSYAKGIHPIPVSLDTDSSTELHGIQMTPWGKFCHDLAHHDLDTFDYNVKNFAISLLNHYCTSLKDNFQDLSPEQKKQFSLKEMIPVMTEFAVTIHDLYRQSLVDILERSIAFFGVDDKEELSDEFKAFSAAAFVVMHENPTYELSAYAFHDLQGMLHQQSKITDVNIEDYGYEDDAFKTSFIDGSTPLTDQELYDFAIEQPLSSFVSDLWYSLNDSKIIQDEVADFEVTRNKFYIDVCINTFDNYEYIYRIPTNYSKSLNLKHDRQFLTPARSILLEQYGYEIPQIPNLREYDIVNGEEEFGKAVYDCINELNTGRVHLYDYFYKTAYAISCEGEEDSLADNYAITYTKAVNKLKRKMPFYISNLPKFLMEALSPTVDQ